MLPWDQLRPFWSSASSQALRQARTPDVVAALAPRKLADGSQWTRGASEKYFKDGGVHVSVLIHQRRLGISVGASSVTVYLQTTAVFLGAFYNAIILAEEWRSGRRNWWKVLFVALTFCFLCWMLWRDGRRLI
jgi:hypothetical protein